MLLCTLLLLVSSLPCGATSHASLRRRTLVVTSQAFSIHRRFLQQGADADAFATLCLEELTDPDVLEDDVVSQIEFRNFIVLACDEIEELQCNLADTPVFTNLDLPLQVAFASVTCSLHESRAECEEAVFRMLDTGGEFGIDLSGLSDEDVEDTVGKLCFLISPFLIEGATLAPTPPPSSTSSPTTAPPTDPVVVSSRSSDLSDGDIAGIAVGATMFVALVAFFIARRRGAREEDRGRELPLGAEMEIKGDESILTENSQQMFVTSQNVTAGSTFDEEDSHGAETQEVSNVSKSRGAVQFDPRSAAGVALDTHEEELQQSGLTGRQQKVNELDRAIDIGDWDAVYKISSAFSDSDDVTSHRSASSAASSRHELSLEDQRKAEELEHLVETGDWEAVAAMAAGFKALSSAGSVTSSYRGSEGVSDDNEARVGADPRNPDSPNFDEAAAKFAEVRESEDAKAVANTARLAATPSTPPRRSFMDFVGASGGASPAAANALSSDDQAGIIGASPRGGAGDVSGAQVAAAAAAGAAAVGVVAVAGTDERKKKRSIRTSVRNLFGKRKSTDYQSMEDDSMDSTEEAVAVLPMPPLGGDNETDASIVSDDVREPSKDAAQKAALRSSPLSSGQSTPVDPEMTEEFERMIAANDWKGLAAMAAEDAAAEEGQVGGDQVKLRKTPPSEKQERGIRRFPSLHGAKVLIPFWEKLIHEVEAEKKAGLGDLAEEGQERDTSNEELFGEKEATAPPEVTPEIVPPPPGSPSLTPQEQKQKTYDAAAAFAKAWNNLKADAKGGAEGARDLTIAATEWAIKQGADDEAAAKAVASKDGDK